jgi:hypothetical protein
MGGNFSEPRRRRRIAKAATHPASVDVPALIDSNVLPYSAGRPRRKFPWRQLGVFVAIVLVLAGVYWLLGKIRELTWQSACMKWELDPRTIVYEEKQSDSPALDPQLYRPASDYYMLGQVRVHEAWEKLAAARELQTSWVEPNALFTQERFTPSGKRRLVVGSIEPNGCAFIRVCEPATFFRPLRVLSPPNRHGWDGTAVFLDLLFFKSRDPLPLRVWAPEIDPKDPTHLSFIFRQGRTHRGRIDLHLTDDAKLVSVNKVWLP